MMLVHSVFFWLDTKLSEQEKKDFRQGLESLLGIESVRNIYIGPPAPTTRPAVDRTYTYAVTVLMENMQGHEIYQNHELHKKFLQKFSSYWLKVVIYDSFEDAKHA
jgi:hypothetical protein